MSQSNLVVRDVIHHIERQDEYRSRRSLSRSIRKLMSKIWMFLIIVGLSSVVGFCAVYLPDRMSAASSMMNAPGVGSMSSQDFQSKKDAFDQLSDDQKQKLMEQFGGGR